MHPLSKADSNPLLSSYPGEWRCLVIAIKVLTSCGALWLAVWRLISFLSFSFPFRCPFLPSAVRTPYQVVEVLLLLRTDRSLCDRSEDDSQPWRAGTAPRPRFLAEEKFECCAFLAFLSNAAQRNGLLIGLKSLQRRRAEVFCY